MRQLPLRVAKRITQRQPEELPCVYCDKRGHMRVAGEVRCWLHLQGPESRLPAAARRASKDRSQCK